MTSLKGKTLFVSGGSRGIGLAIALRAARDGANVAIAAKTAEPHPKLKGTIYTAADEVRAAGGKALPVLCDIREEAQVMAAIDQTVAEFGGIDICVNNASAISLTNSQTTDMKRFDLMMGINTRGTFMVSKYCIPHLKKAENPHILMLSPPLDMKTKWFEHSTAYTMAKFGMSMCVLGLSGELKAARRRGQRAVAAHHHRHRRGRQSPGRRRHDARQPQAGDHGRRGVCDFHQAVARIHRPVLHRRQGAVCRRRPRLRALSRRSVGAADVGFLRARRRRAAAGRHRDGAAVGWRGPEVALNVDTRSGCGEIRGFAKAWLAPAALAVAGGVALASAIFRPDRAIRVATGAVAAQCLLQDLRFRAGSANGVRGNHGSRRHPPAALGLCDISVDRAGKTVDASLLGLLGSRAAFHEGLGCVLLHGSSEPYLLKSDFDALKTPKNPPLLPEIAGPAVVEPADPVLKAALDHAFEEPAAPPFRRTKAVVVVHDGKVIAERYADGIGVDTPLLGFSMTKSVVNALLGILTQQGRHSPSLPAPVPEWRGATDPRREIEVEHLMRMTTGLALDETNSGFDPSSQMSICTTTWPDLPPRPR